MLTHLVLMRFVDLTHVTPAKEMLEGLAGRIPSLRHVEVHLDTVRAPGAYDLCLVTRFDDVDGLEAYRVDPAHLEVTSWLKTVLDNRAVVDYETAGPTGS